MIYKTPWYVYAHIRPDTGKIFYIGKGQKQRMFNQCRNKHWKAIVHLCGSFEISILENLPTEHLALEAEKKWIDIYTKLGLKLANKTIGGDGTNGYKFTDEQKAKLKLRRRPNAHRISETVKKLWQNPEYRKHMVEAHKGHKASTETKNKMSISQKVRHLQNKNK